MSILFNEGAASSTPASGKVAVYAKTDGRVYGKDDAGTEFSMSGGVSSSYTTLSGTSVDFSIPAGVTQFSVNLVGISTNGTSVPLIQLGDGGGIENTGYLGAVGVVSTAATTTANISAGVSLASSWAATVVGHGSVMFTLADNATNTWVFEGHLGISSSAAVYVLAGSKPLSAQLTTVRLTMTNGTDAFDAGSGMVRYG